LTTTEHGLTEQLTEPIARGGRGLRVRLSSYPRPPATIVAIGGEIDACNAEYFGDYVLGFLHVDHPMVLDLTGVEFLGTAGFRIILRFASECEALQRDWAVVCSEAVNLLQRVTRDSCLPGAASVDEALQKLAALKGDTVTAAESSRC
jgi:anti-anti-sigma factor